MGRLDGERVGVLEVSQPEPERLAHREHLVVDVREWHHAEPLRFAQRGAELRGAEPPVELHVPEPGGMVGAHRAHGVGRVGDHAVAGVGQGRAGSGETSAPPDG